jgi:hypothetical protein
LSERDAQGRAELCILKSEASFFSFTTSLSKVHLLFMVFTLFPADEDKKKQEQLLMVVKGEMQDETQRQLSKICLES